MHGSLPSNIGFTLPNIARFSIANNQFIGSIPNPISNASNLYDLVLNNNKLSGKVASLEKLYKITFFGITLNNLGNGGANDLSFLCSLTNATYMTTFAINANNFERELPKCVVNFSTTLDTLYLDNNKISRKIPTKIGNLINLGDLQMWQNKLSGDIPSEIGKLNKLQDLNLTENSFFGNIPSSLENLIVLINLYLYKNDL